MLSTPRFCTPVQPKDHATCLLPSPGSCLRTSFQLSELTGTMISSAQISWRDCPPHPVMPLLDHRPVRQWVPSQCRDAAALPALLWHMALRPEWEAKSSLLRMRLWAWNWGLS